MLKKIPVILSTVLLLICCLVPCSAYAVDWDNSEYWYYSSNYYRLNIDIPVVDKYISKGTACPFPSGYQLNISKYNNDNVDYVVVEQEGYIYIIFYSGLVPTVDLDLKQISFLWDGTSSYRYYGYLSKSIEDFNNNTGSWHESYTSVASADYRTINYDDLTKVYFTTRHIYTAQDDGYLLVFPLTLQRLITANLRLQFPTILRTIKILVLCGVGCLALLIGLVVFGTVLKRYQGRL